MPTGIVRLPVHLGKGGGRYKKTPNNKAAGPSRLVGLSTYRVVGLLVRARWTTAAGAWRTSSPHRRVVGRDDHADNRNGHVDSHGVNESESTHRRHG